MRNEEGRLKTCLHQFDYPLFLFVLATTAFGLVVLSGGARDVPGMAEKVGAQTMWWRVSIAVFLAALVIPYRWLLVFSWPLYLLSVALLLMLILADRHSLGFISTVKAGGAASWLKLTVGARSWQFQPSEFAKIAFVIVLAQWLAWRREHLAKLRECIVPFIITAVPVAIIFRQPDLGTAAVFLPLPFILLFVAGIRWRVVIVSVLAGILVLVAAVVYLTHAERVPGLKEYHVKRIRVFLKPIVSPFQPPGVESILYGDSQAAQPPEPEANTPKGKKQRDYEWQIQQAEMALGSGRVFGKGWGQGTQTRYGFLPEYWTDFIFSSLGEQFGLMGCLSLLLFYLLILWRVVHISVVTADPFGKYLVLGLVSIVMIHVFMNIGMTVRLLPIAGVPLPLVSYGGSFLATNYLIFGLIANAGMRRVKIERYGSFAQI